MSVHVRRLRRLSRILLKCPAQVHFRLLTCSITPVTFVCSLTQMFFFCPGMLCLTYCCPFLFVCAASSLFFAWRMSLYHGSTHEL